MQAISLFAGVGGFELGFERAGIETILQAEQDEKCQHVLERHWPNVERVNDVRDVGQKATSVGRDGGELGHRGGSSTERTRQHRIGAGDGLGNCDLIYGGFPCQDLSVAGRRAGLGGERSSLWFEFARVLDAVRPRWCVVENVPGLLSSAGGRDFGIILHDLDELGYDIAWGTLDAQHFGVPQRRRRVFVVAGPRGPGPAAVLALAEGGSGDFASREEEGAPAPIGSAKGVARALGAVGGGNDYGANKGTLVAPEQAGHLIATAITVSAGHHGHSSPRGDGADNLVYPALDARHGKGASSSVDQAPPILTSPVTAKWAKGSGGPSGDEAQNLVVADAPGSQENSSATMVMEGRYTRNGRGGPSEIVPALRSQMGGTGKGDSMPLVNGVRRLMPIECERLMGWPDDWTRWDADGNEIADSHRYRMCGNGVVAPVAEWIGHRLVRVDSLLA